MQTLDLKNSGLYTQPNPFGSVPPGAMMRATNVVVRRENLAETKRGSKVVFSFLDEIKKSFVFRERNIVHHGTTLSYDSGNNVYVDYADPIDGPNYPIFSSPANENLYLTTSNGIFKIDALSNQPRPAGVPQGLGGIPTLIAPTGNVLPDGQNTAYRAVWGYKDANDNLILGAPSPRAVISNATGGPQDVSLQFFIPDDINSIEYFIQIYRANPTPIGTPPLDEMYLLDEVTLTATDLVNGFVTYDDHKTTTGATIYTAPSQQGIQNSNYIPPLSKDITNFNQMMFYLNIKTRQNATLVLSKDLGDGFGYFDITGDTTTGSLDILNVSDLTDARVGQLITGVDMTPGTVISSITPPTTITMDQVAIGTTAALGFRIADFVSVGGEYFYANDVDDYANRKFMVNNSIEQTCISLTNIINSLSTNYNAYYMGIGNIDKGQIRLEANSLTAASFNVDSSYPGAFITNLPLTSTNDDLPNGFMVSKNDQPEAVPLGTLYEVGSGEFPILRGIALRDAVYIQKGDGTWRVTGSSPTDLVVRKIDNTSILKGIETPVVLSNTIVCNTNQGVETLSQVGYQTISHPIRQDLQKISVDDSTFKDVAFGCAYETESEYYLFCNTQLDDEYATQAYVFNSFTGAWTQHTAKAKYALVNYANEKMYISNLKRLREERKDYDFSDYHEDEIPVIITGISSNGLDITLLSAVNITVGWFLFQSEAASEILEINGNVVTIKTAIETLLVGDAFAYEPILTEIQWYPITAGNPVAFKHFQEFHTIHLDSKFEDLRVNFFSNLLCEEDDINVLPVIEGGFGLCPFGEEGFGELHQPAQPIITYIPLEQSRAPWINIMLSLSEAYGKLSLAGQSVVYQVMGTRYR